VGIDPADSGAAGDACATAVDTNACTATQTCNFVVGGVTTNTVTTLKNSGGTITGTQDTKSTYADGGPVAPECKENCTYKKQ
jgi:hypothetical protein